jgi:predicted naringenin-chalcone synthase
MSVRKSKPIDPVLLAQLRRIAAQVGEERLVQELGLSPMTVARALGGLGVQIGTAAAVSLYVSRQSAA